MSRSICYSCGFCFGKGVCPFTNAKCDWCDGMGFIQERNLPQHNLRGVA